MGAGWFDPSTPCGSTRATKEERTSHSSGSTHVAVLGGEGGEASCYGRAPLECPPGLLDCSCRVPPPEAHCQESTSKVDEVDAALWVLPWKAKEASQGVFLLHSFALFYGMALGSAPDPALRQALRCKEEAMWIMFWWSRDSVAHAWDHVHCKGDLCGPGWTPPDVDVVLMAAMGPQHGAGARLWPTATSIPQRLAGQNFSAGECIDALALLGCEVRTQYEIEASNHCSGPHPGGVWELGTYPSVGYPTSQIGATGQGGQNRSPRQLNALGDANVGSRSEVSLPAHYSIEKAGSRDEEAKWSSTCSEDHAGLHQWPHYVVLHEERGSSLCRLSTRTLRTWWGSVPREAPLRRSTQKWPSLRGETPRGRLSWSEGRDGNSPWGTGRADGAISTVFWIQRP